ncbi:MULTISPECIES: hypothetical protein [Streptomyces]|uniref:hypothetical protein n=1 Tax=Streptomyces TaxID=1883 RepID=UPI000A3CC867|nr:MULTISPECIES: hypothetical protein [Streptomyces]MCE3033186.1 hypothetical protein [Streptomyces sp. CMSTAAHL-2]MYQ99541.1 hypothetical protein [Streptomyces sp. SID6139]MYR20429.1 hypothetical protein [Streptomyces sp. SID6137]TGZ14436.1 hypothetical protein DV517_59190 [Streptomyces sp. S816]
MSHSFATVVVHPPEPDHRGRRVTVAGSTMGYARDAVDVLWLVWAAGLDPDEVRLDDPDRVEWRGAGPEVWTCPG